MATAQLTTVLDVLNSFDVGSPSHFGLVTPKKSLFEKNVEIIKKQGLKIINCWQATLLQNPSQSATMNILQLDDVALAL